jgi:hypothetical protein
MGLPLHLDQRQAKAKAFFDHFLAIDLQDQAFLQAGNLSGMGPGILIEAHRHFLGKGQSRRGGFGIQKVIYEQPQVGLLYLLQEQENQHEQDR